MTKPPLKQKKGNNIKAWAVFYDNEPLLWPIGENFMIYHSKATAERISKRLNCRGIVPVTIIYHV